MLPFRFSAVKTTVLLHALSLSRTLSLSLSLSLSLLTARSPRRRGRHFVRGVGAVGAVRRAAAALRRAARRHGTPRRRLLRSLNVGQAGRRGRSHPSHVGQRQDEAWVGGGGWGGVGRRGDSFAGHEKCRGRVRGDRKTVGLGLVQRRRVVGVCLAGAGAVKRGEQNEKQPRHTLAPIAAALSLPRANATRRDHALLHAHTHTRTLPHTTHQPWPTAAATRLCPTLCTSL